MSLVPRGFINPIYTVRRWDYGGLAVGAEDIEHDGKGDIYLAWQVGRTDLAGNPKQCWIYKVDSITGTPHLLMIIPEIYGPPHFYIRQDGAGIIQGEEHGGKGVSKVTIEGWVPRTDVRK